MTNCHNNTTIMYLLVKKVVKNKIDITSTACGKEEKNISKRERHPISNINPHILTQENTRHVLADHRDDNDNEKNSSDAAMSTVEYAVGTIAAAAFGGILYKVVTSGQVASALTHLIHRALTSVG